MTTYILSRIYWTGYLNINLKVKPLCFEKGSLMLEIMLNYWKAIEFQFKREIMAASSWVPTSHIRGLGSLVKVWLLHHLHANANLGKRTDDGFILGLLPLCGRPTQTFRLLDSASPSPHILGVS